MKTIQVDGQNILVIPQRGLGDGGIALNYFVDEGDGTFSLVSEWYDSPALARSIFDEPEPDHLRWVVGEARRQTEKEGRRPQRAQRPAPHRSLMESRGR